MNALSLTRKRLLPLTMIYSITVLWSLTGCSRPQDYKAQADETVYDIIDQKWQDDFGSKVNYKISDTTPTPNDIQIAKTIPASGILNLPQAVAIATAHNRQYQTERELLYMKALDLRLARHEFDPQFFGGAGAGYFKDGGDESIEEQAGLGFDQLLASGAKISTNLTVAWVDILTGNMRSGLTSLMSAAVVVPLLRGSDSKVVMENLTQAERDTVYQIRSFNRFRQAFVVSIISQYYRVLQQRDRAKNAENNYNTLLLVHERAEKLASFGRLPRFELNQAKQDKLEAWDIYVQEQRQYTQLLDEFKIALGLPTTAEFKLDEAELSGLNITNWNQSDVLSQAPEETSSFCAEELELLNLLQFEENENASWDKDFCQSDMIDTALTLRLDLANQADAVTDAERKIVVAADNLRTELNLVAGTDMSSRGSSDTTAVLGLELDLPLERMAEANEYRKALITLTQQKRTYDETVDLVTLQVRQAYRNFTEAAERHQVQTKAMVLAKKRFRNTFLLLQYGRTNTRDVLDAQEDLFDAQNAAADTLVDYAVAMLEFYRDTGVLQVRPDGMWEH